VRSNSIVPVDQIEADFLAAVERLDRGEPNHLGNKNALEKGRLKVTFLSVANEAGHSRSHICYEKNCRYPRVRQMVLQRRDERKGVKPVPPPSALDIVRGQKREIELELIACRQKMLETIVKAEKERKEYVRTHEKDQRDIARLRQMVTSLQENGGKVVSLVRDM